MKLLRHPKIVKEEKIKIIQDIFKGRVSDNLTGFLEIIVDKDRYNEIPSIFRFFLDLVKEYKKYWCCICDNSGRVKRCSKRGSQEKIVGNDKI